MKKTVKLQYAAGKNSLFQQSFDEALAETAITNIIRLSQTPVLRRPEFLEEKEVQEIFYIFAKTISIVIDVVSIAMVIRMILSFFTPDPLESRVYMLSCYVTEPFIAPIRALMVHFNIGQDSPIDWAFFVTSILLGIIGSILPVI